MRQAGEGKMNDTQARRRRSIRLVAHDYSSPGAYFVTLCTHNRECLLGEIVHDEMRPNDFGRIVQTAWAELPGHYPNVQLDAFVVMPNHVHGIIIITLPDAAHGPVGAIYELPLRTLGEPLPPHPPADIRVRRRMLLSRIVGRFKMTTAKAINLARGTHGTPVWQRNYYEHVIRPAHALDRIRAYIVANPARWAMDQYNSGASTRNS